MRTTLLSVLSSFICISLSLADDTRGRLPDGRAFRTDVQGNEIVDYIAELELSVDSLTRQVRGLESENRESKDVIARLRASGGRDIAVKEKDLVTGVVKGNSQSESCQAINQDCRDQLAGMRDEVDLAKQKSSEYSRLKESYSELEDKLSSLQASNAALYREVAALKSNQGRPESDSEETHSRASVKIVEPPTAQGQVRIQAVEIFRTRMSKDLISLQGLINYREQLLRASGEEASDEDEKDTFSSLRSRIASATMMHELAAVRGDVALLRGKVQEDIAKLKRQQRR